MHWEGNQSAKRYRIPDNFMDESRIFRGTVRTRFFLEGCIMALAAAVPAWLIPVSSRMMRISTAVILCGIPLMIGVLGINGDPISVVLRNLKKWRKSRGIMLYNRETAALKISPLSAALEEKQANDAFIDMVERYRGNQKAKREAEIFIEGVTFRFAEDADLKPLYADRLADEDSDEFPVSPQDLSQAPTKNDSEKSDEIEITIENDGGEWS